MRSPRRAAALAASIVTLASVAAACAANPGPPPVVEHAPETPDQPAVESSAARAGEDEGSSSASATAPDDSAAEEANDADAEAEADKGRSTLSIGIDPLTSGLNPHLKANNSDSVQDIADLVLPSAFHGGQMDTDVLKSATEVPAPEGVAQRVRYVIADPAQWSDGTPITGADFNYLWRAMVSTPQATGAAGYQAISDVKTSKAGKIVTVDFDHYVADWRILFTHLLPSHLVKDEDFSTVLASGIPASAGAFLVDSVDRGRGVITLNRNDRFWGARPARVDVVHLRFIRSTTQTVDMIRSGQIEAADVTPGETTVESLELIPDIKTRVVQRPRQLRLHMADGVGGVFQDTAERRALASVIDTNQLARLSTGRTNYLSPAHGGRAAVGEQDLSGLRQKAAKEPIKIAADPTDYVADAAAHTLVDVLAQQDIPAQVVEERLTTITGRLVPAGEADAYLSWDGTFTTSFAAADDYLCALGDDAAARRSGEADVRVDGDPGLAPEADADADADAAADSDTAAGSSEVSSTASSAPGSAASDSDAPEPGGAEASACPADSPNELWDILGRAVSPQDARERADEFNQSAALWVPILDETRLRVGELADITDVTNWEGESR